MKPTRFHAGRAGVLVGLVAAGMLIACGTPRKAEPLVGAKNVPAGPVASGQASFMRYCNQCHPGGAAGLGPALNNKPLPASLIKTQVRMGGGAMPAIPKERLPDEDLNNVVAYLEWMRKK